MSAASLPAARLPRDAAAWHGRGRLRRWVAWAWLAWAGFWLACLLPARGAAAEAGGAVPPPAHIVVGLLADYPPYQLWPAGGEPSGLDVDLLRLLTAPAGVRLEFRRFEQFPDLRDAARRGQVDLLTSMARTSARETEYAFTRPYVMQDQTLVVRRNATAFTGTPDLAGQVLALTSGHASADAALERFPLALRRYYPTPTATVDALIRGEADFAFGSLPTMAARVAEQPGAVRLARSFSFTVGRLHLAAPVARAEVVRFLDQALGALPASQLATLLEQAAAARATAPQAAAHAHGPAAASGAARRLRVGYLALDRPASFTEDGQADGLAIRLFDAVARRAGLGRPDYVALELAPGLQQLRDGRIDALLGVSETAERRRTLQFVGPYRSTPLAIVSREGDSVWSLERLRGRRLGMVKGFFALPFVHAMEPTVQIVECASSEACLDLVERREADATLYGIEGLPDRLRQRSGRLVLSGTVPQLDDEDNIALARGHEALAATLRQALDTALVADLPAIEQAWSTERNAPRFSWRHWLPWIGATLAGLVAVALAAAGHYLRLRREVARTERARDEAEQYLVFLAHEVRSALQSVDGTVKLLQSQRLSEPGRRTQLLSALQHGATATLGTLNDLLDRHRLRKGRFEPTLARATPADVVHALVTEMQPVAAAKGLSIDCTSETGAAVGTACWMDALRVQQVLRNLIVNAVKFTAAGVIQVRLESQPRGDGWHTLRITVRDPGEGMSAAQQQHLFEPLRSHGGDRPGTGLGLLLSREMAQALGGTLEVASTPGAGSSFTLVLPVQLAPSAAAPIGEGWRVLVVEDSEVYAMLLTHALEARGARVRVVGTLAAARQALEQAAFDLVVADVHLPDGTLADWAAGWDASATGRALRQARPPVLGMSASADEVAITRLQALGVAAVLVKDGDTVRFAEALLSRAAGPVPGAPAPAPAVTEPGR